MEQEQLESIFRAEVRSYVFDGYTPSRAPDDTPVLVLLGAQPAAGKSRAQTAIIRENPDVVPLTGDRLRQFHSAYDDLMEQNPLEMPNATARASGAWVKMSIDHARDNRYSLLLEGTFRDPEMTMDTAREFAESGYRVHLVALAVNERVSRMDTVSRYLGPGDDTNRWTPATAHDLGYRMAPHTVRAAEDNPHVHRITITDRSGEDLFTNTRTPEGDWAGPTGAAETLLSVRERPLERDGAREWLVRRNEYTAALVERGEFGPVTRPTFEKLHTDAGTVADQAWPDPEDSRQRLRHRADQRFHGYLLDSSAEGTPSDLLPASPDVFSASDTRVAADRLDAGLERERDRRSKLSADRVGIENGVREEMRVLRGPSRDSARTPTAPEAGTEMGRTGQRQPDREDLQRDGPEPGL
ncbi:zeta toxin family protein [Nocardiopsis sp. CC223A]|uniref:zeta toxin family protein n=1 Tax=Nocardiopsis sp. CC223A TaxID=3044051 RepID=UPI00278C6B40|nr:zeta toxin family protein [Nocardiopsis sp. CC223A]